MRITLPEEVADALGENPEREALEGLLLLLIGEGRMDIGRAASLLGMGREEAEEWYAERTIPRSGRRALLEDPVLLEDLTEEELERSGRFLEITPAEKGSGLSDVSINHDKYLAEDE